MSEAPKNKKGAPVFTYLAIMFAAAFLMLLLAYFIQQRNNEVAMSGLKDSLTSFESLDEVLEDNRELREEIDTLEQKLEALEQEKEVLAESLDELQAERDQFEDLFVDEQFSHMETSDELARWRDFWDIEALFQAEEYEECAARIKTLAHSTYYGTPDTAQARANEIWDTLESMGLLTEEDAFANTFRYVPPQE